MKKLTLIVNIQAYYHPERLSSIARYCTYVPPTITSNPP
jgi:hypothetical protein